MVAAAESFLLYRLVSVLKRNLSFPIQIAEVIDDRPEEVKQMEVFRTGNRWKIVGGKEEGAEPVGICVCII